MKEKEKEKEKIELLIGNLVILSNVNKNLVGVGNQQLGTKYFNVTIFFSLMYEYLLWRSFVSICVCCVFMF